MRNGTDFHEDLFREEELRLSSNRQFGLIFAAIFLLIAFAPVVRHHSYRPWAVVSAVIFAAVSFTRPEILGPLNSWWARVGMTLQKVTSPVVLGLLFFAAITPLAMLMRWVKRDPLGLRRDAEAKTYWLKRSAATAPESMKDQF